MRRLLALCALAAASLQAQKPFTLEQILSAPYASSLTAAPVGDQFAWVENAEGVHNLWVSGGLPGSAMQTARQVTRYTQDDGQDISGLAWSPDATQIAYTYGAENGASGHAANPDHLHGQPRHVIVQPLLPRAGVGAEPGVGAGAAPPGGTEGLDIGEGQSPLFLRNGCAVVFLRGGKIWSRGFKREPRPMDQAPAPGLGLTNGVPDPLECDNAGGSQPLVVTDRGSAHSLTLSPDGELLAYISRRSGHSFLALFDLTTMALSFPAPSTGNDSAPAFSPDGKQLAWLRAPYTEASEFAANRVSANPWSIQLATLDKHAQHVTVRTLFTPEANKLGSVLPRMSTGEPYLLFHMESRLLFFSDADSWVHLYSVALNEDHARPTLLTPGVGDVEDASDKPYGLIAWSSNNPTCGDPFELSKPGSISKECNADDTDRRHLWLTGAQSAHWITAGEGIETHPQFSANGDRAALVSTVSEPMHPLSALGDPIALHTNYLPHLYPATALVTPQQVLFPSSDHLFKLHGQLFLPRNLDPKTKHPAIIFLHGGPKRQMLLGYPAMEYYSNAYAFNQYLASRGYIVLSVNYRSGIGYGLDFRQCEHCGADGAAEYADVLGAQAYLASRPDVDAKRIGLWGGSYGGYLTALALARNSDLFAAGVDFHGVHEWSLEDNAATDWLHHDPALTAEAQERIAAVAHASSPMADIDKWRSPVLLIHGDDDPSVAYAQTPVLADALRARGVRVEELIFPDEVHEFLLHKDWLAAYQAASDFFDRTLKGNAAGSANR